MYSKNKSLQSKAPAGRHVYSIGTENELSSELNQNPPYEVQAGDFSREFVEHISKNARRTPLDARSAAGSLRRLRPVTGFPKRPMRIRGSGRRICTYRTIGVAQTYVLFKLDRYHPISISPSESAEGAPMSDALADRLASLNGEPGQIVQQDGIVPQCCAGRRP